MATRGAHAFRALRVSGRIRHGYPCEAKADGSPPMWTALQYCGAAPPLTRTRSQSGTKQ